MARTSRNNPLTQIEGRYHWDTALYIRLSREDGDKEESDSIGNQRNMLLSFLEKDPELSLHDIYIDDGYTGTNFNRPDFKRMISDIESKTVNCVVVKDLSRLGRDYIGVGNFQENFFPKYNVRFISVNDNIDSIFADDESNGIIVPFRNILNEQYARDISRKVRSALDTKRSRGEFIGAFASYGYLKDTENHNRLVIDEEAAEVVRSIFKMFIAGMPKLSIAYKLNEMEIPCPSEYKKLKGLKYVNSNRLDSTVYWTHTSIHRILKNEMYIGNMVQHKQTIKSFKHKQNVQLDKSQWIVIQSTHEPIIDMQTWETAQRILQSDIKKSKYSGDISLFSGIVKCGDCGRAMKKRTCGKYEYYVCGTYMTYGKKYCDNHSIKVDALTTLVFNELKAQIDKYVDFNGIQEAINSETVKKNRIQTEENKLVELKQKLQSVNKLSMGLYEDYKSGILTQEEYIAFKEKYNSEAEKLKSDISTCTNRIADAGAENEIMKYSGMILKYKNATGLTRELLVSLVNSIVVDRDKNIQINFNFKPL